VRGDVRSEESDGIGMERRVRGVRVEMEVKHVRLEWVVE
jgi:hypothetical protein